MSNSSDSICIKIAERELETARTIMSSPCQQFDACMQDKITVTELYNITQIGTDNLKEVLTRALFYRQLHCKRQVVHSYLLQTRKIMSLKPSVQQMLTFGQDNGLQTLEEAYSLYLRYYDIFFNC